MNKMYGLMVQNFQLKEAVKKLRLEKKLLQKEFQQLKQLPEIQAEELYLEELKRELLDRQDIFCNGMTFMDFMDQDELEERMKEKTESPAAKALGVTAEDLTRIFLEDTHCGNCREENGKLMWEFYRKWEENLKVKLS